MLRRAVLIVVLAASLAGCAHASTGSASTRTEVGDALRARGFLAADAPPGTTYNAALLAFQKSEGIPQTGYPDPETLRRLGIDPAAVDDSIDPRTRWPEGSSSIGLH